MKYKSQQDYWNIKGIDKQFTTEPDIDLLRTYLNQDTKILDFGCGYGRTLNTLYNSAYKNTIGTDYSEELIKKGYKLFPHLNLKFKKGIPTDFDTGSFDMVILFAVLTCIIDDDYQNKLFIEIERILKPKGFIYINDFLINTDERNQRRYKEFESKYNSFGVFELPEGAVLQHFKENRFSELTKNFTAVRAEQKQFTTMNGNISTAYEYFGKLNY